MTRENYVFKIKSSKIIFWAYSDKKIEKLRFSQKKMKFNFFGRKFRFFESEWVNFSKNFKGENVKIPSKIAATDK